jgi:hypothetical protein
VNKLEARAFIETLTQWNQDPALTGDEVEQLLKFARRKDNHGFPPDDLDVWQPGIAVNVGDLMTPTLRGTPFPFIPPLMPQTYNPLVPTVHGQAYFKATVGGLTGATEPTWPGQNAGTVVDGTVTWTLQGLAPWQPTYHISAAVSRGWRIKAMKVAMQFDIETRNHKLRRNQKYKACLEMSKLFGRNVVDSFYLRGSTADIMLNSANDPALQDPTQIITPAFSWPIFEEKS